MNMRGRIPRALLAFFLSSGLLMACRPNETVERQTKDAALKAQVKAKLASDVGAATVTAIEVNVTNGVATLAGSVRSDDEKQRAEATARSVEGITGVNNNLQVNPIEAAPVPTTTSAPGMATTPMAMPPPTETRVPLATTP
jgi:translation elongation factor EF-1beta